MTNPTAAPDSDRQDSVEPEPTRPPVSSAGHGALSTVTTVRALCPFLLAEDGSWRATTPSRAHTCAAIGTPTPLALDKQRRLCLTPAHVSCAAYIVAIGRDEDDLAVRSARERPVGRPYPRTAPVALDHGRISPGVPTFRGDRSTAQVALVGLMVVAFAVMAFARLTSPDEELVSAGASGSPVIGAVATSTPGPARTAAPTPDATAGGTSVPTTAPTAQPTARPTVEPTPTPAVSEPPAATPGSSPPIVATRTHTVASGETLSAIAAHYGTTVKVLRRLNEIDDPRRIRVGQVLQIP